MRSRPFILSIILMISITMYPSMLWADEIVFRSADIPGGESRASISSEHLMTEIAKEVRKVYGARYVVRRYPMVREGIEDLSLLLVCDGISPSGLLKKIQLLAADERGERPKMLQRIKLGDGEMPDIVQAASGAVCMMMVRVIRAGSNTEAYVCSVDSGGRLKELMRITRALVDRYKLDLKGTMQAGGRIKISSARMKHESELDMSGALDALIQDGLYQENGRPVPSIVNLRCVRAGWEGEDIFVRDGRIIVSAGVSMRADAKKDAVTAHIEFEQDDSGRFVPTSVSCEPFLPYAQ